ncbi:four-helix bundle copper-binding protein [Catellatospora chokoriensis]|nr:four-helix bundle copper-binding protein [Catellatospora chokoriensis]
MPGKQSHGVDMQQAVTYALECHRICEETITHGLQAGGNHVEAAHIRLLTDCADICRTAADFMARGSEFHAAVCAVCADVCERCAIDCERFGDDSLMAKYARHAANARSRAGRWGRAGVSLSAFLTSSGQCRATAREEFAPLAATTGPEAAAAGAQRQG